MDFGMKPLSKHLVYFTLKKIVRNKIVLINKTMKEIIERVKLGVVSQKETNTHMSKYDHDY
jgi:hypothetical protein